MLHHPEEIFHVQPYTSPHLISAEAEKPALVMKSLPVIIW